ncbi:hypothetical protein GCM10009425_15600 [Pseudomonas asuensis]|uniref:DUF4350 domain-containing protein n=2 Tax=Pseudomonas asuensis TaxID=1825787 RepID=A0ABQ2GNV7_9PSED|nr:hypothetical protein GCM10009425_15600 [Pseudomonas asuensis]
MLWAGLILATVLLAGLWAWKYVTLTETLKDAGPSPEARNNPYLAAERFLRERSVKVQHSDSFTVLNGLPAIDHTLLLLAERDRMSPAQSQQVLDWASQGGHVVFVAEQLWDENSKKSGDFLLDAIGVQQLLTRDLDDEEADKQDEEPAPAEKWAQLTKLYLENEQEPAYIGFDDEFHLYDAKNLAQSWANSEAATHMMQLPWGNGLITVMTDAWIWQNTHIGEYDNAWLLWYITQDSDVTLLYRADKDSLVTLLTRYFPETLAASALLLALWLWQAAQRLGPALPSPALGRRQLSEHMRASAEFIRRHSGLVSLITLLQKDIQQHARRRHPGFERLPVAEQWRLLGRLARLSPQEISQTMRPLASEKLSPIDFTRRVANLQRIRKAL